MRNKILLVGLITLFSIATTQTHAQGYPGTNLRGYAQTYNSYYGTMVPLCGVTVQLYQYNSFFKSWTLLGTTLTDQFGYYYFNWVPPGGYTIQVNYNKNYDINVVQIDYRFYGYQDLPLLTY